MSLERAKELVDGIEDLPTLPEVVIEITRLVENPDTTAEAVYKIVSTDVSLSATMLKLVNSAFYGMSRSVVSLERAIKILGFATVRNIALAAFVFDAFLKGKERVDHRGFWLHSIGVASASNVLARRMGIKGSGEYFVYGLLHDLGMIVLMQYLPDELAEIKRMADSGTPVGPAEERAAGCTHKELGAALAERWDFPASLVATILNHCTGTPPEQFKREVAVVTCAGAIAQAIDIGTTLDNRIAEVNGECWEAARIAPGDIGRILDEVLAEIEHSRTFIELLYG